MAPKRALQNIFVTQKVGGYFEIPPLQKVWGLSPPPSSPLLRRPWVQMWTSVELPVAPSGERVWRNFGVSSLDAGWQGDQRMNADIWPTTSKLTLYIPSRGAVQYTEPTTASSESHASVTFYQL